LGESLFETLFEGDLDRLLESQLAQLAVGETGGALRIRLFFDAELPDVAALPWELLYHPRRRHFLGRSPLTPVSRFLPVDTEVNRVRFRPPLKVAIVGPCPAQYQHLDLSAEREYLRRGLSAYPAVELLDVQPPTLDRLAEVLERNPGIQIVHYMGHGGFDPSRGRGALLFEDPNRERQVVPGEIFAELLQGFPSIRLVVLNCCQSGQVPRSRGQDPFTGVATALLLKGLPAAVAMQFAISDQAALTFAAKFYSCLAEGDPVDVAAARGRLSIYRHDPRSLEWITPVVFMQVADGQVLVPQNDAAAESGGTDSRLPDLHWVVALGQRSGEESVRRAERRLERLGQLFDLPGLLTSEEGGILRSAAYLRASQKGGEDGWEAPGDLVEATARCAAGAGTGADLTDPSFQTGPWRLDLLAALLRLSELLDLDRASSTNGRMPAPGAQILSWIAFFTREVRLRRGGIVQFVLEAPAPEWIEPLKRSTSLRLEAAWQELRAILLPAGLTLAAAPSEVILGRLAPPVSVLEQLRLFGEKVGQPKPKLDHMGESWKLPLDLLLPLPGSSVRGEQRIALEGEMPGFLRVQEEESGLEIYRRKIAAGEPEVLIDLEGLRPDRWYRWWLYCEEIEGEFSLARLGRMRPLSASERRQLDLAGSFPVRDPLVALQLHGDLLEAMTPALEAEAAPFEDIVLAHRLIVDAEEWVRREAPTCPLADAYRNSAMWLADQMKPGGSKP
jgi:hypothetical protein